MKNSIINIFAIIIAYLITMLVIGIPVALLSGFIVFRVFKYTCDTGWSCGYYYIYIPAIVAIILSMPTIYKKAKKYLTK